MKNFTLVICLLVSSYGFAQGLGSTSFDSNTFEGWENSDGSVENLTLNPTPGFSSMFLRKTCDGSTDVSGEMAIRNRTYFDFTSTGGAGPITVVIQNENNFDLHLRAGFSDADGTKIVSTTPVIIPPGTWTFPEFSHHLPNEYTLIEGPNSISDVLSGIVEFSIIHNEAISYTGATETGTFDIDAVETVFLGIDDNNQTFVSLYPNPVKDRLTLSLETIDTANVTIYNILGNKVMETGITASSSQLDIQTLKAGVYLMNVVASDGRKQTLKFIKE